MMIVGMRLVGGKFHATPWGRFPNEGAVEWPPSPYRLLRALVSSWKTSVPDAREADVLGLLKKLASRAPSFYLPPASIGHTRHYMPPPSSGNTNLIMDAFVLVGRSDAIRIIWPDLELDLNEAELLERLLRGLHYFGRSESWCEAFVEDPDKSDIKEANCVPFEDRAGRDMNDAELVQVLVPAPDVSLEGLVETTSSLRKRRRLYPDGSRPLQYLRNSMRIAPAARPFAAERATTEAVRYAIVDKVKPVVTLSLAVAETMRNAAVGKFSNANGGARSPLLSGKDESGAILEGHAHASYLPTDEDGDGFIDHITVVARGIDARPRGELDALLQVKSLWSTSLNRDIHLAFEGHGMIADFPRVPMFMESKRWRTASPLVLSRHMKVKKTGGVAVVTDSAGAQVRRELADRYGIGAVVIEYTNPRKHMKGSRFRPFEFKRFRKRDRPGGGAYGLFLEFERPVKGPLCLGYASHFGLGLFVPDGA